MYTPYISRPSDPTRLRGIDEWIPEQAKQEWDAMIARGDGMKYAAYGIGALFFLYAFKRLMK